MFLNIKRDSKLKSGINLVLVQLCSFLIPLLSLPYIVRKVGIGNYGNFVFFQTVMMLLMVIVSYGFIQTGVRDIAVCKTLKRLNYEYSLIFYCKLLTLFGASLIGAGLFFFDKFNSEKQLYSYSFLFLVVSLLDISFVYQGIEKLKDYVIINLIGSVFGLLSLFIFIRGADDYIYLPLIFALPRIGAAVFLMWLLYVRFKIAPVFFSIKGITKKIKGGFNFFLTNIFIIIYTKATVILLGLFTNNTYVGYYGIADQLFFAYSTIQGKVSTVYHPQMADAFKNNLRDGISKTRENIQAISIMAIAAFLFTQFFAHEMLYVLFKENAQFSETVLRILSLNFISIHLSSIFGIQVLLSIYKDGDLLRPSIYAAVLNLLIGSVLIINFKHIGAAVSCAFIEVLVMGYFYLKVKGYGIELFDRGLTQKLGKYTLLLVFILVPLRLLHDALDAGIIVKFPFVAVMYALTVLIVLKFFDMVDFKGRRIVVDGV